MARQLGFYLDSSACVGCKVCQVACKDKNDLPVGLLWRRVVQYEGGEWVSHPTRKELRIPTGIFAYSLSISCNHCEKAACVDVCPTGAMSKGSDGVVKVDQGECIGCRNCEQACPYEAPQFDERAGKMTKCNFCEDLISEGQNPACVDACVMRALKFGEMEELRARYGAVNEIEPLPSAEITKPSLVITPHRHAQVSGRGLGDGSN